MAAYGHLAINGYFPQLGNKMTESEKKPSRVIDWAAIRKAYEMDDEPVRMIAERHGISSSAIDHRMRHEGWSMRRDRARVAKGLESLPRNRLVDWDVVRREYENGGFSINEICARHAISESNLYRHKHGGNWISRREAFPRAYGAGGTVDTTEKMKALVESALAKLLADGQLVEKIDLSDPLRALHTLIHAFQKIRDMQDREKRHNDDDRSDRLIINDATREALARRLEALADSWEAAGDSGGT